MFKRTEYKKRLSEGLKLEEAKKYTEAYELFMELANDTEIEPLEQGKRKKYWYKYGLVAFISAGEICFKLEKYEQAFNMFMDALNWDIENPYINLLVGKSAAKLNNQKQADEFLLRAYMLDGEEIFSEDIEYLNYLKKHVKL